MIISRYLTKEIMLTLMTVTFVLILAFLSQQTVRYFSYVASGKIPASILLHMIGFEIPFLLALLLPLGLYLSIILAYGRLYTDNEMAVLELSGFSRGRLIKLTAWVALGIVGIVLVLMLFINPKIAAKREQLISSDEAVMHVIQTLMPGRFQVSPDGRRVIFVERLSRDRKRAENVFLAFEKNNPLDNEQGAWTLVLANQGYQAKDKETGDPLFVTEQGYRYDGIPGQNDYKLIQFGRYKIRAPKVDVRAAHPEVEALSSRQLWQHYDEPMYASELQWRLSIGISAFLLALLAVPLSKVKPRHGRYLSLLPAVLIYVVYVNLLFIARRFMEQRLVPLSLGMWWVHGVMIIFFMIVILFYFRFYFRQKIFGAK